LGNRLSEPVPPQENAVKTKLTVDSAKPWSGQGRCTARAENKYLRGGVSALRCARLRGEIFSLRENVKSLLCKGDIRLRGQCALRCAVIYFRIRENVIFLLRKSYIRCRGLYPLLAQRVSELLRS
jgi:hypothetical protein